MTEEITAFPTHPATRVTVLLSPVDRAGHHSLMSELLKRARQTKLAGATALRGYAGYGTSGVVHRSHVVREDPPSAVVLVDRPERIQSFLDDVAPLLREVLVIVKDVDVVEV
ncbi:MAG TPA: DUF190 domain-containing protein [Acidimicrobiales bacterium]|nr:DUF190 domain-containing protein [Acidimicrobiales bacterium]